MASALFTVNGSSTQAAKVVTFGSTVNYALVNAAGVNTVEYLIFGGDGLYFASAPTLAGAVGNASQVMPADPGRDIGFGVECLVNGGLDASGRPDATLRCRRVIGTTAYGTDIPLVAGETTERDGSSGWVTVINRRLMNADILALVASLRIAGISIIEGAGSTALNNSTYATLTGTFTGSAKSDSILTAASNAASFTYSGATAARVLVLATFGVYCLDANQVVLHVAKNNVAAGGTIAIDAGAGYVSGATCALVPVVQGDVVAIRAGTDLASETLDNQQFSMIAIAFLDAPS